MLWRLLLGSGLVFGLTGQTTARVLLVGSGESFKMPSDAATSARPGDTVRILPGTYFNCTVWKTNDLIIEGGGSGVVLTDRICQGKAIFVIKGADVTVRNIVFTHARSQDGNGAGIRAEGSNLTVENSHFIDNQEGILANNNPKSSITVRESEFDHNGSCESDCAHGIYVNHVSLLRVTHSRFFATQAGHHIKSRAARTEITDCWIEDGPEGTASYLIDIPNGGALVMRGNTLEKGPRNQNNSAAVIIGEEGITQPTVELTVTQNAFTNDGPPTTFMRNTTATPALLTGNAFKGRLIAPLTGKGTVHR